VYSAINSKRYRGTWKTVRTARAVVQNYNAARHYNAQYTETVLLCPDQRHIRDVSQTEGRKVTNLFQFFS